MKAIANKAVTSKGFKIILEEAGAWLTVALVFFASVKLVESLF